MRFRFSLVLLLALLPLARATSVVPPTFAELVSEADAIYRGQVTAVQPRRVERADGGGSIIKTFVTFSIERVMKGPEKKEITLEFLGGTLGEDSMIVSGMPKFSVGDREIVFVQKNGVQFCPLVALMHGRYRVLRDAATAREYVGRDNGVALTDTAEVALPITALPEPVRAVTSSTAASRALSREEFESSIVTQVQRTIEQARPN